MPNQRSCWVVLAVAMLASACAAGGPQTDSSREEETMALWPLTTSSEQARQEVTDGMREWDMERYPEAFMHFERAVAADSTLAMAHFWAALDAQVAGDGVKHIAKAMQFAGRASQTERLLIESLQATLGGQDQRARELALAVVRKDAANPRSWMFLAEADSALGDIPRQRADLDSAVARGVSFAPAYIALSTSLVLNAPYDFARGEQLARKAVELQPNDAAPYQKLGNALRAQGKLAEAAQAYTKQAERNPTQGLGLQQRAHVNAYLGNFAEARADYDAAVAAESDAGNKFGYAIFRPNVNLLEGKPRDAIAEFDALNQFIDTQKVPSPEQRRLGVAIGQFSVGVHYHMIPEAERAYGKMQSLGDSLGKIVGTESFRRRWQATMALEGGYLAWSKQDYAAAQRKADEFTRLVATEQFVTKEQPAHALRGLIYLSQGRYQDALKEFDQAPTTNSNLPNVNSLLDFVYARYNRAMALEHLGRTADARKDYEWVASYYFNTIDNALVHNDAVAKLKALPTT